MSFVVDLAVLTLLTYAILDLLYKAWIIAPSAVVLTVVVWVWFFYFMLFDWRCGGTPGKLIVGLRLKDAGTGTSGFVRCLLRSLVTLLVPITIAGRISAITASKTATFVLWSVALALLAFQPLSIAVSGGQSVPDLLLGTNVLPAGAGPRDPARLNLKGWLLLVSASLLAGIVLTYSGIPGLGRRFADIFSPDRPGVQTRNSGEMEIREAAALRMLVLKDIPDARDLVLEDFRIYSALGDLPATPRDLNSDELSCANSYRLNKRYAIVYARINPETPTFVQALLFRDLVSLVDKYSDRPGYLVLETVSRQHFGIFDLERVDDLVFCVTETNARSLGDMVGLNASISPLYSLQYPSLLVLADLKTTLSLRRFRSGPLPRSRCLGWGLPPKANSRRSSSNRA